ncbi:MAG: helix-turn-helix domain-containing protein [Ardenticatenia bacterium]|nr:helix-turn-helix domain-containing protein [Ardenticatenia bacterium]
MTPEQVADYLQLATETVYRLIRQRKLAATRVGRAYRIPRQDVESFIVANSTREEVRRLLFRRVMAISDRSDGERDGDALLESPGSIRRDRRGLRTPTDDLRGARRPEGAHRQEGRGGGLGRAGRCTAPSNPGASGLSPGYGSGHRRSGRRPRPGDRRIRPG